MDYLQIQRHRRHFFKIVFTFILCLSAFLVQSQPHLTLLDIAQTKSLSIKSLDVHVELTGNTAVTQLTYEIANKSEQALTANFQLSLPQSAKVIGYALDIQGEMRAGVVVPKAKARHVFNTIQNRNIDPGIAEITRGNQFQTEIFPVLPKKIRTIYIEYIETLAINNENQARYKLPLSDYDKEVDIEVKLIATGMPNPPTYSQFKKKYNRQGKRRYTSKIKNKNALEDLIITYKLDDISHQKLATARDGRHYFSVNVPLKNKESEQITTPQHIDIYWDVSASMAVHHQKNVNTLQYILQQYKNSLSQVSLMTFANKVINKYNVSCPIDCEASIVKTLNDPFYDGATRLNSLANFLTNSSADKILIFTDAINTLDTWQPINSKIPTYVLSNQGKHNEIMQKALSSGSGGYVINLATTPVDDLTAQLNRQLPKISLAFEKQGEVSDVFYEVQPQLNRLKISGILKDTNNGLTINSNQKTVTHVNFSQLTLAQNDMAKHDWAIMALSALQKDPQGNRPKILQFGVKHNIVTPFTSLLVLESLTQYAEFDIAPPESMVNQANFKEDWQRAQARYNKTQYDPNFDQLITQWQQRQQWWQSQKSMTLEEAMVLLADKNKLKKRKTEVRRRVPPPPPPPSLLSEGSSAELDMQRAEISASSVAMQSSRLAPMADSSGTSRADDSAKNSQHQVSINVAKWQADAPYLTALGKSSPDNRIETYRSLKKNFGTLPVFYMDVALWLHEKKESELAIRVLSNLSELHPEIPELMRMHAYSLIQMQRYQEAIMQLVTVAQLLPLELTSHRDLANAWQLKAIKSQNADAFKKAVNYYIAALNTYSESDISQALMILHELNRLIYLAKNNIEVGAVDLPKALLVNLPLDLFISMQWNKDATDVDLWVTEPTGQTINYTKKKGISGSYLPFDDTTGYGPEIYMNRFSLPGEYNIQAKLYNDRSTKLLGPNTLFLSIYSHYGTDQETVKHSTLRLKDKKEVVDVGSFSVEE